MIPFSFPFAISVTEKEIEQGILKAENPSAHSLCFIRKFDDLKADNFSDRDANRFFDLQENDAQVSSAFP